MYGISDKRTSPKTRSFRRFLHRLNKKILFQPLLENVGVRVLRPRSFDLRKKVLERLFLGRTGEMDGEKAFQLIMEFRAVIGMLQMRELVQ
jgi:hypothetical protein